MAGFIEEADRGQLSLLPGSLDDWVGKDNPVRVIDAFVDGLDLKKLDFETVDPLDIGRPGYHPSVHLKLYIYGYLNRVQSSRRLERECHRNLEVMWLLGRLAPDHKTIADFRKDNGAAIKKVCGQFKTAAKGVLGVDRLEAVADRGYFNGEEIKACDDGGITVTLPKPMTSGAKSKGRFGKQDFVYLAEENAYRCPAGEKLTYRYTNEENGQTLHRYWTNACRTCPLKAKCTQGHERRITRWEHEAIVEAVQKRLDENPGAMRTRRETVEHPFGTMKMRMGATHFLCKTLPKVATEMALCVLTYNLTRVLNIFGVEKIMEAITA